MLIWFSLQLRILCIGGKAGRGALRPAPESVEQGLPYGLPNGLLYGLPFGLPYSLPLVSSTVSRPQSLLVVSPMVPCSSGVSHMISGMLTRWSPGWSPVLNPLFVLSCMVCPYGLTNVPLISWTSSGSCITLLSPLFTLPAPECVERSLPYGLPEVSRMVSRLVPYTAGTPWALPYGLPGSLNNWSSSGSCILAKASGRWYS